RLPDPGAPASRRQHHEGSRGDRHLPPELPAEDARARHHGRRRRRQRRRRRRIVPDAGPPERPRPEGGSAMRVFARVYNLVRGSLTAWIRGREHRNPEAVYESAIAERREQYATLRSAAAGILYLRSKLTKQLGETSR